MKLKNTRSDAGKRCDTYMEPLPVQQPVETSLIKEM